MNLQYISDNKGKTTGVYIPIEDWEKLKNKYAELDEEDSNLFAIPEWHKEIIRQRLIDYKENPDNVLDWDEVKNDFQFD
ncbi:MAG: addiction module protein [Saprospiraceae bacterium]|nr:addiction module protein [Saprospiraceae bacterium]